MPVGKEGLLQMAWGPRWMKGNGREEKLVGPLRSLLSAQQCGPSSHCEMDCEVNNEVREP